MEALAERIHEAEERVSDVKDKRIEKKEDRKKEDSY